MCLFCEIQIFKIGDSTMFEEIKDYQGRDLNTTELISLYSKIHDNTAFPPDLLEGELKADKILSLFPEKERNIGGHDVVLS